MSLQIIILNIFGLLVLKIKKIKKPCLSRINSFIIGCHSGEQSLACEHRGKCLRKCKNCQRGRRCLVLWRQTEKEISYGNKPQWVIQMAKPLEYVKAGEASACKRMLEISATKHKLDSAAELSTHTWSVKKFSHLLPLTFISVQPAQSVFHCLAISPDQI